MKKKPLGKGLEALLSTGMTQSNFAEVDITNIKPDKNQPRKFFDKEKLMELAESIKQKGILQPLIVVKQDNGYMLVAGERRWRAAGLVGIRKVPVVIKETSSGKEKIEISLIENIQRENLNPVETARTYQHLLEEYQYKQEDIAAVTGKSRSSVANTLRLLDHADEVLEAVLHEKISEGHARALLGLKNKNNIEFLLKDIIKKNLSVRGTERKVRMSNNMDNDENIDDKGHVGYASDPFLSQIRGEFENYFNASVKIKHSKKGGVIEIRYVSGENLEHIIKRVRGEL